MRRWIRRLARRGGEEDGAVLVLVAGLLVVFLVLLAYTIDLSGGRQAQQQAQSAADAGALATAGAYGTANASATGTSIATTNYPGSTVAIATSPNGLTVTATVSAGTTNGFGRAVGASGQRVSAIATATVPTAVTTVATTATVTTTGTSSTTGVSTTTGATTTTGTTVTTTGTTTTTPSANTAIYAADQNCADASLAVGGSLLTTGLLANLLPANSLNINNTTVISNSSMFFNTVNFPSNNSSFLYGGPNRCSYNGSTASASTRTQTGLAYGFPQTYAYTPTSSICTRSQSSFNLTQVGGNVAAGVYCATGSITLTLIGAVNLANVTLIAPSITIGSALGSVSGWTPSQSSYPLALATGSSGLSIYFGLLSTQFQNINGVLDAPLGPISVTAANMTMIGLIEAQTVGLDLNTLNLNGTGAQATATTSTTQTVTTTATVTTTGTTTTTGTVTTTGTTLTTGSTATTATQTGTAALIG